MIEMNESTKIELSRLENQYTLIDTYYNVAIIPGNPPAENENIKVTAWMVSVGLGILAICIFTRAGDLSTLSDSECYIGILPIVAALAILICTETTAIIPDKKITTGSKEQLQNALINKTIDFIYKPPELIPMDRLQILAEVEEVYANDKEKDLTLSLLNQGLINAAGNNLQLDRQRFKRKEYDTILGAKDWNRLIEITDQPIIAFEIQVNQTTLHFYRSGNEIFGPFDKTLIEVINSLPH